MLSLDELPAVAVKFLVNNWPGSRWKLAWTP